MKTLFLDTETTSLEKPRLIQLAYKCEEIEVNQLYNPGVPIEIEAMAIHHITQKMIEEESPFNVVRNSLSLQMLLKDSVLIAHNAEFDIEVLKNEGVLTGERICTKRIAMRLLPDLPSHSLQYLRYALGLKFTEKINPHDAWSDIVVLEALFNKLKEIMLVSAREFKEESIIEEMISLTQEPIILKQLNFGKHKGRRLEEVVLEDRGYLSWLSTQDFVRKDKDLASTVKFYLKY